MRLVLKNIGKIESAAVDINGITVIAGENGTGKSTVGRALFAMFTSFYNVQENLQKERVYSIRRIIQTGMPSSIRNFASLSTAQTIVDQIENLTNNDEIRNVLLTLAESQDEEHANLFSIDVIDKLAMRIRDVLDISEEELLQSIVRRALLAEFNNQIRNIYTDVPGELQLQIKDTTITATISTENNVSVCGALELHTEAVYLDDPFAIDEIDGDFLLIGSRRMLSDYTHRGHLLNLLRNDGEQDLLSSILAEKRFQTIYDKVNSVCGGEVTLTRRVGFSYKVGDSDQELSAKNLSTGLKTFYILKRLLMNGTIQENGTIILDEPEIHLHPEWQILFAELIVLIHKEFHMHILLNTHSPYFLRAIETFAAKHKVADQCKYYLSERADMGACISDVTGCVDKIYAKLAQPLQEIENLGWSE